jgi:hypothetical protein
LLALDYSSTASTVDNSVEAGETFFLTQLTIVDSVLPPE